MRDRLGLTLALVLEILRQVFGMVPVVYLSLYCHGLLPRGRPRCLPS